MSQEHMKQRYINDVERPANQEAQKRMEQRMGPVTLVAEIGWNWSILCWLDIDVCFLWW